MVSVQDVLHNKTQRQINRPTSIPFGSLTAGLLSHTIGIRVVGQPSWANSSFNTKTHQEGKDHEGKLGFGKRQITSIGKKIDQVQV